MPARRPERQRGVAVVTALLLTALSVTLVTGIFWQQQVLVRGMEGQRLHLQGKLIARAAIDAARLTLLESAAQGDLTTLDGDWSAPLVEGRLDKFLGREAEQGGWLSQRIVDAQGCFNLRNLAGANGIDLFQVTALARLLTALKLDAALAFHIGTAIAASQRGMEIEQLDDLLSVPGITPDVLERLHDFVVVLPGPTAINVNTASPEVLTSVVDFSLTEARALIARRRQAHFKGPSDFAFRLNDKQTLEGVNYQVSSDYFLVHSTLTLAQATLRTQALIRRGDGAALVWMREE
jgi:general secretion pathway protein K